MLVLISLLRDCWEDTIYIVCQFNKRPSNKEVDEIAKLYCEQNDLDFEELNGTRWEQASQLELPKKENNND